MARIERGDIWWVNLDPTVGHVQAGARPALIVSAAEINNGPSGLVTVIPLTTIDRNIPTHVRVEPSEGGLNQTSFILCEQVRTISRKRLDNRSGAVSEDTLDAVGTFLRLVLDL